MFVLNFGRALPTPRSQGCQESFKEKAWELAWEGESCLVSLQTTSLTDVTTELRQFQGDAVTKLPSAGDGENNYLIIITKTFELNVERKESLVTVSLENC